MELKPCLKMGKSICVKSPISYLTTAPSEFETFKLSLMAVALAYTLARIKIGANGILCTKIRLSPSA